MKPLLLAASVLALVACGAGPAGSVPTSGAPAPPSTTSTTVAGGSGHLSDLAELDSYRFELEQEGREYGMGGAYDGGGDAVSYGFDDPVHGSWEVRRVGDRTYMRGILTPLFAGDRADAEQWYEVVNLADPLLEGLPLHRLPALLAQRADREEVADGTWTVGREELRRLVQDGTLPVQLPPERLTVTFAHSRDGFEYRLDGGEGWSDQLVRIRPGDVTIEAPDAAGEFDVEAAWEEEATSIVPDDDGILFDVSRYAGPVDLRLSVEADGRVVQVTDTSVLASPDDFTAWRLDGEAVDLLVAGIEGSGLLDHPRANRQFGEAEGEGRSIGFGEGRVLDVHGPVDAPGLTAPQRERREVFFALFQRLVDHGWLEDHVVEPPAPYVPEAVTVRLEESSEEPIVAWPYAGTVTEMETAPGLVCLEGDRVGPLWKALGEGPLGGQVTSDGVGVWRMNLQPHTPGYVLYGDPCFDRDVNGRSDAPGG